MQHLGGKRSNVLGKETSFNYFADTELFQIDIAAALTAYSARL